MQGAGLEKQGAGPVNGDTARQGEEGEKGEKCCRLLEFTCKQ